MEDRYEYEQKMEIRKQLADARECRGRKREKSTKPRKISAKQQNREENAARQIASQIKMALTKKDLKKAYKLLDGIYPNKDNNVVPMAFWKAVAGRAEKFSIRKHKREYVIALQTALAAIEVLSAAELNIEIHVNAISEISGVPTSSKQFDIFKLVLSLMFDYRVKNGSEKLDSHDLSRDAAALRYVISQGVRSHNLLAFPGGVDKWSRLASKNAPTAAEERSDRGKEVEKEAEAEEVERYRNKPMRDAYYDDVDEPQIKKLPTPLNFAALCLCSTPDSCMSHHITKAFGLEFGDGLLMLFYGGKGKKTARLARVMKITHRGAPGQKAILDGRLLNELSKSAKEVGSRVRNISKMP
jgi:type I site-specific restriction-modification system R (restriction) subunit